MSAGWPLFIVTRTDRCAQLLRVHEEGNCPSRRGFHEAFAPFADDAPTPTTPEGYVITPDAPSGVRWPERCTCGHVFGPAALRRIWVDELYEADGRRWRFSDLPPGAMFELWWWPERGPNGEPWWAVILPGGDRWDVFGLATNSKSPWTITGTAPKFTASPSIAAPHYHGWLRDGVLTPDCEGRTYG